MSTLTAVDSLKKSASMRATTCEHCCTVLRRFPWRMVEVIEHVSVDRWWLRRAFYGGQVDTEIDGTTTTTMTATSGQVHFFLATSFSFEITISVLLSIFKFVVVNSDISLKLYSTFYFFAYWLIKTHFARHLKTHWNLILNLISKIIKVIVLDLMRVISYDIAKIKQWDEW